MLSYVHVDVFSRIPYSGNSLTVFPSSQGVSVRQMEKITKEMRHFESIFLFPTAVPTTVRARVFDLTEELAFAGHPVLGAACVLHHLNERLATAPWTVELPARTVTVETTRENTHYRAQLNMGAPEFLGDVSGSRRAEIATAFSLRAEDLHPTLPLSVISTGLRYLIIPLRRGLEHGKIIQPIDTLLETLGAQFAYLLNIEDLEGRHWNNDGILEDVATGSGAGTAAAYLWRHGLLKSGEWRTLRQGRFVGRPSELEISVLVHSGSPSVIVGGNVALVGTGQLQVLPDAGP